jgi:hypothetical protein
MDGICAVAMMEGVRDVQRRIGSKAVSKSDGKIWHGTVVAKAKVAVPRWVIGMLDAAVGQLWLPYKVVQQPRLRPWPWLTEKQCGGGTSGSSWK